MSIRLLSVGYKERQVGDLAKKFNGFGHTILVALDDLEFINGQPCDQSKRKIRLLAFNGHRASILRLADGADPVAPELALGPEPDALSVALLRDALAGKAGPIKPTLLDQRVVAGLGNIYAAESLWRAGIHPARAARSLDARELRALVRGIKGAIADGFRRAGRYRVGHRDRPFNVYDREGRNCNRCHGTVQRIPQAGRSTYFCPACQPRATPRGARAAAP